MKQTIKYIGLDVGGTKILIQAFGKKLNLVAEKMVKTDVRHGRKGFLEQLYGLIDEYFGRSVKGIGIAVPGIVNQKTGILINAPHIPSGKDLRLRSLLEKRYKTVVHVDNDINAFLAAEYQNSRLNRYDNVFAVMVGTGFGGAAIVNGRMMYGANGYAGEFGHIVINKSAKILKTLEQNTSGHYKKKYPKLADELVDNLGIGLSNLNLIFNPDAIVLGGSVYLNHVSRKKKQLERIIAKNSLAKQSPKLFDADLKTSVAKGSILLMSDLC